MADGFKKNMKFLTGGGEMGKLINEYNWRTSPLGVPESWPSSLTHSVSNMLRTGFPMLVLWGKEFICFYNDAFVPSLGREQHPSIGQPAKEVWSDGWDFIGTMLNGVLSSGQPVTFTDQPVIIHRNGLTENAYFTFCYSQILDDNGEAGGVLVTCVETTGIVTANKTIAEREKNLSNIILQAPFPICIFRGSDFVVEAANESMLEFWDKPGDKIIGKPLFEAVPEAKSQGYEQSLNDVLLSGETYSVVEVPVTTTRKGVSMTAYVNFAFQPLREIDGRISGVLATAADVTEQVSARQKRIYETIIGSIPDLVYVFDLQYRFTYANGALLSMWGKSREDAVGKGLRENGYEEWHAAMHEREIDEVAATKKSVRGEVSFPHAILGRRVYDYILVPVFNEAGEVEAVAGTTRDISDIKQAESRIMESEERFRMMAEGSPFLIAVGDASSNATYFNKAWAELTGRPIQQLLEFGWVDFVHPDDKDRYVNIYLEAFKVKSPFIGEFRVLNPRGQYQWLLAHGVPRINSDGLFEGYISACADITQQKINELHLREKEAALANAIELAELGTWKLDSGTRLMTLSPRYAEMCGFKESTINLNRALSVVVESDREETARKFESAMQFGSNGKIDAEYKINNTITGNSHVIHVLGQAFFDEAGNYSRMEGTAQDVTVQRELQLALENEVQLRTEELQATNEELATSNEELSESSQLLMRSNDELSQFAHIASHDLQEPVRKISVFVEMLSKALPKIDDRSRSYLDKIDLSANRMLNLIRDVLTHSQISNTTSKFLPVDLNKIFVNTVNDLEILIQKGHCKINSEKLPVIDAIPVQMGQLFSNLISNAMKFAKAETPLQLDIRAEILDDDEKAKFPNLQARKVYYRLSFIDNGIGFNQLYASKIFEIFQRLHNKSEYTGTGIGLATCKKIVQNHGGEIGAFSTPGNGATFYVVLPATNF